MVWSKIVGAPERSSSLPRAVEIFKASLGLGLFAITGGDVDAAEMISLTGASWYRNCRK